MVNISQKAFNDDLGKYLDGVRKKEVFSSSFLDRVTFRKTSNDSIPYMSDDEVHIEYKESSFLSKLFRWKRKEAINELDDDLSDDEMNDLKSMESKIEAIEDEESQLEEMEENLEEKRETLIARLFQKMDIFRRSHDKNEDIDMDEIEKTIAPRIDEDVKELLKILHSWIEKLAPKQKKAFKDSPEFELYKDTLTRYGLIKAKVEPKIEETLRAEKPKIQNAPRTVIRR